MWDRFQIKNGTPSNITKTMPSPEITFEDLEQYLHTPQNYIGDSWLLSGLEIPDEEVKRFFHGHTLKVSTDLKKLNAVKQAIEEMGIAGVQALINNYRAEFQSIALSLYVLGKINQNEVIDLLNWDHFLREEASLDKNQSYGHFEIFDKSGEFTDYAQAFLLPALAESTKLYGHLSEDQIKSLALLLKDLDNKATFILTSAGDKVTNPKADNITGFFVVNFQPYMPAVKIAGFRSPLSLKFGRHLLEAYNLIYYGSDHAKKSIISIGPLTMNEVELAIANAKQRLGSLYYKDVTIELVHNAKTQSNADLYDHDIYHLQLLNDTPAFFLDFSRHLLGLLRKTYEMEYNDVLWSLAEVDFTWFMQNKGNHNVKDNPKLQTEIVFKALDETTTFKSLLNDESLKRYYNSPRSIIMLLDYASNPETWKKEFGIDEAFFPKEYQSRLTLIREMQQDVKHLPWKLQYLMYLIYDEVGPGKLWDDIKTIVNASALTLEKHLEFHRRQVSISPPIEAISLQYNNSRIILQHTDDRFIGGFIRNLLNVNELHYETRGKIIKQSMQLFPPKDSTAEPRRSYLSSENTKRL